MLAFQRLCFSASLLILVLAQSGLGQDENRAKPVVEKSWVADQIRLLDADTLRERAMAERALLAAGPDVLAFLPPPELLPSAAVRQAVRRIRLRLEEAKARQSVKASTVKIKGKFPLKDLLKNISEQTGNQIDAGSLPAELLKKPVEIESPPPSFWEAMIRLGEAAGFDVQSAETKDAVQLVPANPDNKLAGRSTKGAFLFDVLSVKSRPRFGKDDEQLLRASLRIAAEPRLRPLFLKLAASDFSATTENAKLPRFNPDAKLELPLGEGGHEAAFHMDFVAPKPFDASVISLKGKATLTVAAGSEEIAFTNLPKAAGAARRRGGVTVTINEVTFAPSKNNPKNQSAKIRITVHYDTGGPAFESHRTWIFHNQVHLENAKGQKIERNSDFHTALQTDGGVIVEYNFDGLAGDPADYKFIYVAPTLIINAPVEFEFSKLTVRDGSR